MWKPVVCCQEFFSRLKSYQAGYQNHNSRMFSFKFCDFIQTCSFCFGLFNFQQNFRFRLLISSLTNKFVIISRSPNLIFSATLQTKLKMITPNDNFEFRSNCQNSKSNQNMRIWRRRCNDSGLRACLIVLKLISRAFQIDDVFGLRLPYKKHTLRFLLLYFH